MTTFNGVLKSDTFDHGSAALQRWHAERRKEEERQARAEEWLASKLVGLTFASFESLVAAAVSTFESIIGVPVSDDERRILTNAARACWAGLSQRARTSIKLDVAGRVEAITFHRAA